MSRTRTRGTLGKSLVALLALSVVFMAAVLVIALSFPAGTRAIGARLQAGYPGMVSPLASLASEVGSLPVVVAARWRARVIQPLGLAAEPDEREELAEPDEEHDRLWEGCSECHPHWESRPLHSVVYFDHETHTTAGSECADCHEPIGLARDRVPPMQGCGSCHETWIRSSASCVECHPPGSLFHGAELSGSRSIADACETCHPPSVRLASPRAHDMPAFSATDEAGCEVCHTSSGFCDRCHPAPHPTLYGSVHHEEIRNGEVSMVDCYQCHDPRYCVGRCHTKTER